MIDKCPYCYRNLGTWLHDPILLPKGAIYDWKSDTELIYIEDEKKRLYKGYQQIREDEIEEIQNALKNMEKELLETHDFTNFSPLNTTGIFQITGKHIKEMRDSVEKLLKKQGVEKKDYFNYDEDENHIINPEGDKQNWSDPITEDTDLQKFQVKYIHIEDLRHYIQTIWEERFFITPIGGIFHYIETYTGQHIKIVGGDYIPFIGDEGRWDSNIGAELIAWQGGGPNPPVIDGYSKIDMSAYISSNDSTSHCLNINILGEAFCSSSHSTGSITFFDRRQVDITNGAISLFTNINKKLKSSSAVTALSSATISSLLYGGISFDVGFSSGRSLEYSYGKCDQPETLNRKIIVLPNFNNLNLNVGSDYISKWGSISSWEKFSNMTIWVSFGISSSDGVGITNQLFAFLTKIKII